MNIPSPPAIDSPETAHTLSRRQIPARLPCAEQYGRPRELDGRQRHNRAQRPLGPDHLADRWPAADGHATTAKAGHWRSAEARQFSSSFRISSTTVPARHRSLLFTECKPTNLFQ